MANKDSWELRFWKALLKRFTALENNISIIIQGPLHKRMEQSIPHYLKAVKKRLHNGADQELHPRLGNVVISHWDNDDESIIEKLKNDPLITIVKNKRSEVPPSTTKKGSRGAAPWILQNLTTLNGINAATGYNSIKVRSDEIYPNIEVFIRKLINILNEKGEHKFVTSDIFFRKDSHEKFHPSDHIIAGRTARLKRGFQVAVDTCRSKRGSNYSFPEQLICESLLRGSNIWPIKYKSKKIMQKNFEIIPIKDMDQSIWTCSYRRYDELRSPEAGWAQNIREI